MVRKVELRARVEQVVADGLPMWRCTVTRWTHEGGASKCLAQVAWHAEWAKAQATAMLATRSPQHPGLAGIQWTHLYGRPSPRQKAERLAIIGRREDVPRIGLAAAMSAIGLDAAGAIDEVCS